MFDKHNYETILYEKEQIKNKINEINKIQAEIYEIKEDIKRRCKHSLVIVYDISYEYQDEIEEYRNACCLMCDEYIKLQYKEIVGYTYQSEEYSNFVTGEKIDNKKIIDATKFISEEHRNYYSFGQNEIVLIAKETLNEYISNSKDLNFEEIKKCIEERLISFSKERENELSIRKTYKKVK